MNPLRGATIESDLALRDFTVNAIAEPLAGGELIDPLGGLADLAAGRLRLARPDSLEADPLRSLRLVRLACELGLTPDERAARAARSVAVRLADVAAERIYAELQRIIGSERAVAGVRMLVGLQLSRTILPELDALQEVVQSDFHHLDVYEHTLAVLAEVVALDADPGESLGSEHAEAIRGLLEEPLGDELNRARGAALRRALARHREAAARAELANGRIGSSVMTRPAPRSARGSCAGCAPRSVCARTSPALVRHHLRLGFLVERAPISRDELSTPTSGPAARSRPTSHCSPSPTALRRGERAPTEMIEAHLELGAPGDR